MRERRRIKLQMPARRWTANETRLLGRFPDRELARRFRRPKNQVWTERRRLGIAPFRPWKGRNWRHAEDKLLGTASDPEVARRLKRSLASVRARRRALRIAALPRYPEWTAAQNKLLGTACDSEVALRVNRSGPAVRKQRLKLGIRAFRPMPQYRSWTAAEDKLVGTMRDDRLAKLLAWMHAQPCEESALPVGNSESCTRQKAEVSCRKRLFCGGDDWKDVMG